MQTFGSDQHETLTGADAGALASPGECRTNYDDQPTGGKDGERENAMHVSEQQLSVHLRNKGEMSVCENLQYRGFRRVKKEEEPIISFIWNGATVRVYTQIVKLAGTTLQRHLLPTNLRKAVNEEVAKAGNLPEDSPRRIQQSQRRVRDAESAHYGVSARAVQR